MILKSVLFLSRNTRDEAVKFRVLGIAVGAALTGMAGLGAVGVHDAGAAGASGRPAYDGQVVDALVLAVNGVTALLATAGPLFAVVAGAVVFGSELRWRMMATTTILHGSATRVVGAKFLLAISFGLAVLLAGWLVAAVLGMALGTKTEASTGGASEGGVLAQRVIVVLLAMAFWFLASALVTTVLGNGVFGLFGTGLYVLFETPVLAAVNAQELPAPLAVQMSGYWVLSYPEGVWAAAPVIPLRLDIGLSIVFTLTYIALFGWLLVKVLRRRLRGGL